MLLCSPNLFFDVTKYLGLNKHKTLSGTVFEIEIIEIKWKVLQLHIKLGHSEKATKIRNNHPLDLTVTK